MTTRYRAVVFLSVGLALLLLSVRPSLAYFERFFISTRTFSLGGAFVALADDPSAAVLNPAGLTQLSSAGFLASYVRPYDVSDLEEHYIAAAVPTSIGAFGVSWHRFGLRDVTSEDLITLAYGRDYIRTSQDASLSFGGSVDIARVDIRDTYNASKTVVSGSAGVLLQPFPIIGLGYSYTRTPTWTLRSFVMLSWAERSSVHRITLKPRRQMTAAADGTFTAP